MHEPHDPSRPPNNPVSVVGLGLASPLGLGAWETFHALLAGKRVTDRLGKLPEDVVPVDLVRAIGSVVGVQHGASDPAVDLAERVTREAIDQAGWGQDLRDTPIYLGVSKGAMHALGNAAARVMATDKQNRSALARPDIADAHLAVALGPVDYIAHHLRRRLGAQEVRGVVAACSSSLTALHLARLRLQHDPGVSRVLVVTSESALLADFIHSYTRLGVLPPLTVDGCDPCPLDKRRTGFLPTEIAAAVALTRGHVRPAIGRTRWELIDTGIGAEAYDLIRTSPTMPALDRVAQRLLTGQRIDMLHPHATGTRDNDPTELAVLARHLTQAQPPHVYAAKGALGHGLGAAGLVSLVIACLCGSARRRPPMPWLRDPIDTALHLSGDPGAPLPESSTHAVFAGGFGGHVAGALLRVSRE